MPVLRIPVNDPWCSDTELSASKIITGHINEGSEEADCWKGNQGDACRPEQSSGYGEQGAMQVPIST